MFRAFFLASGLVGALCAAQFPAYSHQYLQRLGGAVEALAQVVEDFDASARALGLTREAALQQMQGTAFVDARRVDMQRTFARYEVLRVDLSALEGQGPFIRAYRATHLTDPEIARGTWAAFRPALPLTSASFLFAVAGFCCGAGGVAALRGLLRPGRRKRSMAA